MKHLTWWFRDARCARSSTTGGRCSLLNHLDFLGDRVSPPKQARHTYDGRGRLLSRTSSSAAGVPVDVAAGGVTLVRR